MWALFLINVKYLKKKQAPAQRSTPAELNVQRCTFKFKLLNEFNLTDVTQCDSEMNATLNVGAKKCYCLAKTQALKYSSSRVIHSPEMYLRWWPMSRRTTHCGGRRMRPRLPRPERQSLDPCSSDSMGHANSNQLTSYRYPGPILHITRSATEIYDVTLFQWRQWTISSGPRSSLSISLIVTYSLNAYMLYAGFLRLCFGET